MYPTYMLVEQLLMSLWILAEFECVMGSCNAIHFVVFEWCM